MENIITQQISGIKFPSYLKFFCLAFVYAVLAALLFQKLVLPLVPSLHAGYGLMKNDAFVFHQKALAIAININDKGWSQWSLYPSGGTGNVGLLSGLYAFFGPNPAYFIPFGAAAHALGATLIYRIGPLLWRGNIGLLGGLLAAVLFLVAPSSLQWYGQPLKDSFAISGVFLIAIAWMRSLEDPLRIQCHLAIFLNVLLGTLLVTFVRPYLTIIIAELFFIVWVGIILWDLLRNRTTKEYKVLLRLLSVIFVVFAVGFFAKSLGSTSVVYGDEGDGTSINVDEITAFEWEPSGYLPTGIDQVLKRSALLRAHFIDFNRQVNAGSAIDLDSRPQNAIELIRYLPRALQVGLFSPFPITWSEKVTAPRVVTAIETSLWYLFVVGIGFLLYRNPSKALISCLVFCALMIMMLATIHPNVGSLYRQRYGFWMFFLVCGSVGWASAILPIIKFTGNNSSSASGTQHHRLPFHQTTLSATTFAASGSLVMGITFLCYLGFLSRDLLLISLFGMQSKLDGFFIAAMIPMVLVACLSLPMGDAITNLLIKTPLQNLDSIVRPVMTFASVVLGLATILLMWKSNLLVSFFIGKESSIHLEQAETLLRWFSPILFLSAWTVVGNAVMNVLHRSQTVALSQLAVPACSIGLILMDPGAWGLYAATIGMLVGTFLNGLILYLRCRNFDIRLMPSLRLDKVVLGPVLRNYRWIVLAAVFSAATPPLNFLYVGSQGSGAVSMWAISGKLTQFILGLISVGVTSVLLPHFARLIATESMQDLKKHTYWFLAIGSCIGGLLALICFEFSEPVASIFYSDGVNSTVAINEFANLLRVGVLQLPAAICTGIIVKFTAATHMSSKSIFAIAFGLVLNGLLDFLLVPSFGVLGVGIALSISSMFVAIHLMVATRKLIGLNLKNIFIILLIWLFWGFLGLILVL